MEPRHKSFKIALVALDLTEMDEHIIRYTAMISKLMSLERILFVHVEKNLELPPDLMEKFPDLMAPLDESIKEDIKNKVEKHFTNTDIELGLYRERRAYHQQDPQNLQSKECGPDHYGAKARSQRIRYCFQSYSSYQSLFAIICDRKLQAGY